MKVTLDSEKKEIIIEEKVKVKELLKFIEEYNLIEWNIVSNLKLSYVERNQQPMPISPFSPQPIPYPSPSPSLPPYQPPYQVFC